MEIINMKIRITFDNTKMKIGHDGKIEKDGTGNPPSEAAVFEIDLDLFYMAYKMFPTGILGNNNVIGKAIEKHADSNKPSGADTEAIQGQLPVNGHDIYNYVARFGAANFQIQAIMKLDGRLDRSKLLKAIKLSIDAEPVFGCRIVENDPPYWKRLDDIDKTVFCTFEETDYPDQAVQRFVESSLSMDTDPMVKMKLISSGPYDTLCLKINHACCDGTGAKEYLQLLSDIYSSIDRKNGVFVPKPGTRSRKDQDQLFETLGIKDPETAWDPQLEAPKTLWAFPWQQGKSDIAGTAVCRLPYGQIDKLSAYGKAKGATINDLLLTAFYRAMFEMSQPQYGVPMDISSTVDLRRYLPNQKTDAIRCFSGGFDTRLVRVADEPFEGTLSRVVPMMKQIKNGRPGLQSAVGLERVEKAKFNETLSFYRTAGQNMSYADKCAPVLSNLSFLSKSPYKFDKYSVTDAYIVPPAVSAPGLLLCISSYNGIITLAVSYYEAQVQRDTVERLLYLMKKELVNCRKR
jgi:NRPS condensation-like uncharacterized protein